MNDANKQFDHKRGYLQRSENVLFNAKGQREGEKEKKNAKFCLETLDSQADWFMLHTQPVSLLKLYFPQLHLYRSATDYICSGEPVTNWLHVNKAEFLMSKWPVNSALLMGTLFESIDAC